MKQKPEFSNALRLLRANRKYLKLTMKDTKTLIKMCEGKEDKQAYKRRLLRDLPKFEKEIIELTRAINILNR